MFLPEATAVNRVHTLLWWEQDSDPASLTETDRDRWRQTETERWGFTLFSPGLRCSLALLFVHRVVLHAVRSANTHSTQRATKR